MKQKLVIIGGGVGASTMIRALKVLPLNLSTIVTVFDDGGSTGKIRRDYGGIALGDIRQAILANLDLDSELLNIVNYRFGKGMLEGINAGNVFLKAFMNYFSHEREGMAKLHQWLGLRAEVIPVSYDYAQLQARLENGRLLADQAKIARFAEGGTNPLRTLRLSAPARLNPRAAAAIHDADYLVFSPGHFFTSILPHLYVRGFANAWKQSRARKIWCVNLLAHRGQDDRYALRDYLIWFQQHLGKKPFDLIISQGKINQLLLAKVKKRFRQTTITHEDEHLVKNLGMQLYYQNLVNPHLRPSQPNDTVQRAPLRHDESKVRECFKRLIRNVGHA